MKRLDLGEKRASCFPHFTTPYWLLITLHGRKTDYSTTKLEIMSVIIYTSTLIKCMSMYWSIWVFLKIQWVLSFLEDASEKYTSKILYWSISKLLLLTLEILYSFSLCVMRSVDMLRIKVMLTHLTQHIADLSLTQTESYVQSQFLSFHFFRNLKHATVLQFFA